MTPVGRLLAAGVYNMLEMCIDSIDSIDSIEPFEANEHHVCARKDGKYMRSLLA